MCLLRYRLPPHPVPAMAVWLSLLAVFICLGVVLLATRGGGTRRDSRHHDHGSGGDGGATAHGSRSRNDNHDRDDGGSDSDGGGGDGGGGGD